METSQNSVKGRVRYKVWLVGGYKWLQKILDKQSARGALVTDVVAFIKKCDDQKSLKTEKKLQHKNNFTCCKCVAGVKAHPDPWLIMDSVYYAPQILEFSSHCIPLATHVFNHWNVYTRSNCIRINFKRSEDRGPYVRSDAQKEWVW